MSYFGRKFWLFKARRVAVQPIQVEVDHFFEPSSTQEQIFSSCVGNAIDDVLQVCMSLL